MQFSQSLILSVCVGSFPSAGQAMICAMAPWQVIDYGDRSYNVLNYIVDICADFQIEVHLYLFFLILKIKETIFANEII